MGDLKIKVRKNLDELVDLFKQYGCKNFSYTCTTRNYILLEKGMLHFCKLKSTFNESKAREVNIDQLRDLVVLKRNDPKDATHTDQDNWKWFISSSGVGYVWQCGNPDNLKQWDESSLDMVDLKPIEKPMREYLVESTDGLYIYLNDITCIPTDPVIEIPKGANYVSKKGCKFYFSSKNDFDRFDHGSIVWQREPEPLSDQYTEIEKVRERSVSDTLKERQKEYGSFEDVAFVTQGLIGFLSKHTNYDDMPNTHRESLHMIASKVARLTLGNCNHKDSWHDIGGYSKLIEDLLD